MKKVLMIIGGIFLGFVVLGIAIFAVVAFTSEKMKCKSSVGDITIMYNGDAITGYTAKNMDYDFEGQKAIAEKIGVDVYLDEFENWFEDNTDGFCKR